MFNHFLSKLFVANETTKATDAVLKEAIRKQFPDSLLDVRLGNYTCRLAVWRSEYNRGRLTSERPPVCSFRYNREKVRCNRYEHALSKKDIASRLAKFASRWKDSNASSVNSAR